jgi:allantoinase
VLGYSYRDYGNRVGFWRMLELPMKRCGMRGSCR